MVKVSIAWLAWIAFANSQLCEPAFNLDFSNAILQTNTLHLPGGELRFTNLGAFEGRNMDFVITVAPGETYTTPDPSLNGVSGLFGEINVQNRPNDPTLNGRGVFDFCWQDGDSREEVELPSFDFSAHDLDSRGDRGFEKVTIREGEISRYELSGLTSEIFVQCEDGTGPPCRNSSDNLCFISSTSGNAGDNPTDPNELTLEQKRRAVLFSFRNRSCFRLSFSQVCNDPGCSIGGRLIFAGTASQLKENCATDSPTQSPTTRKTLSPTQSPTARPRMKPTIPPAILPTQLITHSPTLSPAHTTAPFPLPQLNTRRMTILLSCLHRALLPPTERAGNGTE